MNRLYLIPLCGNWLDCVWEKITNWVGDQVKWLIGMIFQPILDAISQAVTVVMGTIATFWVYVPTLPVGTSTMGSGPGQPASGTVAWMWSHTQYIAFSVAVVGVLIAGIKMAYSQRGESARDILRSLITLGVASLLVVGVTQALIEFGDQFSQCIVNTSLFDDPNLGWQCELSDLTKPGAPKHTTFGAAMTTMLAVSSRVGPMGIALPIAIGILAIIAGVIQIILMVVRSAMLILLVGMLPIAAAATNTEMGRNWFKKILGWMFAFVLYKPVAAIVYATAIRLTSNNGGGLNLTSTTEAGNSVMNMVTGLTLLVLALFALPGLMRFIVPMVAATAGQAGAGMIAAKLVGADKLAGKLQDSLQGEGGSGSEGGSGDGPTGSKNVPKSRPQPQSSGGGGGGGGATGASGGQGAAAGASGGSGGAAAGAAGGGGGAAAGGAAAGGGAAAAAGPAAAVAAPIAIVAAGVKATKQAGEMAAQETLGDDAPQGSGGGGGSEGSSGGGGGGGGGGGPSGSGGSQRDVNRDRQREQRQFRDDHRRDSDGPRGSS